MKSTSFLFFGFTFLTITILGQNTIPVIKQADYNQLKKERKLPSKYILQPTLPSVSTNRNNLFEISRESISDRSSLGCNYMIPLDNTFNVVPFDTERPPSYRNDDGSSPVISLPFSFCFYGTNFDSCYINNNGNITFILALADFSAGGFPAGTDTIMIAPFWGDVDTRRRGSGLVYYKITPTALIVRWDKVGYFDSNDNLLNDFQLIITDGSDPILPGNNVQFSYGDMQWTTGDASDGIGGFGGSAATVGANKGDNINFIQFGRFDTAGVAYDGPFGNSDGVSWLDNQSFSFNTCLANGSNNVPPILSLLQTCDTIGVCIGDTLLFDVRFFSPEQGQITTVSISAPGVNGFSILNATSGNTPSATLQLIADASNIGVVALYLTGTDDGVPIQSTAKTVYVNIYPKPNPSFTVSPMPFVYVGEPTTLTNTSSDCINYSWDFGDETPFVTQANPIHTYTSIGEYTITLTGTSINGCVTTYTLNYAVVGSLAVPNAFSPNADGHNDDFCLQGWTEFIETFIVYIYDRWGEKVFESENANFCWDGTYKGKAMDPAVFVYYIKALFTNTTQVVKKGNITLIR